MNVVSLFSGIGGLDLGVKLAVPDSRVVAYVERDAFCQRIIRARVADGWRVVLERWPELAPATETQPAIRRVADGAASRLERLKALGNAVVPAQAALALTILAERLAHQ